MKDKKPPSVANSATILSFDRGNRPLPKPRPGVLDDDYVAPERPKGPPTFDIMDWHREELNALRLRAMANPVHIDDFRVSHLPENADAFARRVSLQVVQLPNHYLVFLMILHGGPAGYAREVRVQRWGERRKVNEAFAWELALLVGFDPNNKHLDSYGNPSENGLSRSVCFQQRYATAMPPSAPPPPAPRRRGR